MRRSGGADGAVPPQNKLKALVTGDNIRINPKNVTPHDEKNHVNLVFLSNEIQPLLLGPNDRRYAVIKTPDSLDPDVIAAVLRRMINAGIPVMEFDREERKLEDAFIEILGEMEAAGGQELGMGN